MLLFKSAIKRKFDFLILSFFDKSSPRIGTIQDFLLYSNIKAGWYMIQLIYYNKNVKIYFRFIIGFI